MGKWEYGYLLTSSYNKSAPMAARYMNTAPFHVLKLVSVNGQSVVSQWSVSGRCANPIYAIVTSKTQTEITKHMESFCRQSSSQVQVLLSRSQDGIEM